MTTHFPTVPVDGALREALLEPTDCIRPLALVVDDDPIITSTLAAILHGSGLAALTAANGLAALDTALLIPPEILIADLAMPGMNGFDLALEVTRFTPDCGVILFEGHNCGFNPAAKVRNPRCDFMALLKPVHPTDLLDAVFKLLDRRGHPLRAPKPFRSPSLYDFLSSTRLSGDVYPASCNLSRRQRLRPSSVLA